MSNQYPHQNRGSYPYGPGGGGFGPSGGQQPPAPGGVSMEYSGSSSGAGMSYDGHGYTNPNPDPYGYPTVGNGGGSHGYHHQGNTGPVGYAPQYQYDTGKLYNLGPPMPEPYPPPGFAGANFVSNPMPPSPLSSMGNMNPYYPNANIQPPRLHPPAPPPHTLPTQQTTPGVNPNPALNEDPTTAYHTQNSSLFSGLDLLTNHLKSIPSGHPLPSGSPPGDKSVPIVLLPGFLGWGTPILNFYNYFGGLVNLAEDLSSRGWPVIVPIVGSISSNWERACELYAQLSRGSFDGSTYDIVVDYGDPPAGTDIVYLTNPPPLRRQAACFNIPPGWKWGPNSPVHFVAHSQGGNTVRYLIHLLEKGQSVGNSSYFRYPKMGWVKSLVTLATPFNGTNIIDVLDDLGKAEDILMDNIIAASSWTEPSKRVFDFMLDHRGLCPPPPGSPEAEDFLKYVAMINLPDGALTKWRKTTYTGFHDNSIDGVIGDLNRIIGPPSKDVYCFTLSFAATIKVPVLSILKEDLFGLVGLAPNLEKITGLFGRFGIGGEPSSPEQQQQSQQMYPQPQGPGQGQGQIQQRAGSPEQSLDRGGGASWAAYIPSKRAQKIVGGIGGLLGQGQQGPEQAQSQFQSQPPLPNPPPPTGLPAGQQQSFYPPPLPPGQQQSSYPTPLPAQQPQQQQQQQIYSQQSLLPIVPTSPIPSDPSSLALTTLTTLFTSLQDISTWALTRINGRLPSSVPKIPLPGTTIPRYDMFPPFLIPSYGMGAYKLKPAQRALIKNVGGPVRDSEWHEHDGVVNTVSMRGPWGEGNRIVRVEEVVGQWTASKAPIGGIGGRRGPGTGSSGYATRKDELKGIWVDLGKCDTMDHADCIGTGINPVTIIEVIGLYRRISDLLELL